jgi:hypothetical protein
MVVVVTVSGRGGVLAHGHPKGDERLTVKGGREGWEANPLTVSRLPPTQPSMSQHTPPSRQHDATTVPRTKTGGHPYRHVTR